MGPSSPPYSPAEIESLPKEILEERLDDLEASGTISEEVVDLMAELDFRDAFGGDLVLQYPEKVHEYSELLDYDRGRCWSAIMVGAQHYLRSNHAPALEALTKAQAIATRLDDRRLLHLSTNAAADVKKALGDYEAAIDSYLVLLRAIGENAVSFESGWLHQGIASVSNDLGSHDRAIEYADIGSRIFSTLSETTSERQAAIGLGRCHIERGIAFHKTGRFDDARSRFEAALALFRETDNRIGEARALNDLGRLAQDLGRLDEAEPLHKQSLQIRREIRNRQSEGTSLLNLGDLYVDRGEIEAGIEFLREALAVAKETGARLRQFQVHAALARAYEKAGNYKSALAHQLQSHQIKEQVSSDRSNARIADLQMRFEVERAEKEAEITRLRNVELRQALDELKAAQDRLVHAEKMASLGAMTAGIAHEIKNPLNFVNNFSQLSAELADELAEVLERADLHDSNELESIKELLQDLQENAHRIQEHGRRADSIVRNMLMHAGGQSGNRTSIDLNQLIEEYVALAFHGARAQNPDLVVAVETDLDPDLGTIAAIPQEIGRVVLNLLSNAFDAVSMRPTPSESQSSQVEETDEPRVQVSTSRKGGWVELTVSDNGPGISAEIRNRIFEPFYTTKPTGSGTGLGLSLSHDIVVQGHGGELVLDERPFPTTFVVRLPIGEPELDTGR